MQHQAKKQNKHRFKQITKILLKHKLHKKLTPDRVCDALDELGPTFVKIGQILSTREDIIPREYCDAFAKLKDNVSALPFSTINEIVETELQKPINEVFSSFNEIPIGSASIGQVHEATLLDGTKVVVKVMRPHIFEIVSEDFAILKKAIKYLNLFTDLDKVVDLNIIFDETYEAMKLEMDFINEQNNIQIFNEMFKNINYIKIPKTYPEYSTKHLLVMEYIDGVKISDLDILKEQGYDLKEICEKLVENFISQVIDKGIFHADPHSGNIMISEGKIVWLDFGMIGIISKRDQQLYRKAVVAIVNNDVSELKNVILTIGVSNGSINHSELYNDIEILLFKYSSSNILDIDMGQFLQEILRIANKNHISLPRGVTLLGRSIIIIQKVVGQLDPNANILELFSNHVKDNYKNDLEVKDKLLDIIKKIYISGSKTADIPSQLYDLLNLTIKGERHTNVEIVNLDDNINKGRKAINRLIIAIITSSLIFGVALVLSSVISRTNHEWLEIVALIFASVASLVAFTMLVVLIMMFFKDKNKK